MHNDRCQKRKDDLKECSFGRTPVNGGGFFQIIGNTLDKTGQDEHRHGTAESAVRKRTEEMPQNPINPYGMTKLTVERIFKDYAKAYGLKFVVLRYFNAAGADPEAEIGESHNPETHIIPLVLDAASGKRADVKVFGTDYDTPDGSCVRDYIHVTDLADAHLRALRHLEKSGESDFFNLGNAKGTSVLEVVEAVKRVTEREFTVTLSDRRPGDPAVLVGSSEKAGRVLGWKPMYGDIDTIVRHAWVWYQHAEY